MTMPAEALRINLKIVRLALRVIDGLVGGMVVPLTSSVVGVSFGI